MESSLLCFTTFSPNVIGLPSPVEVEREKGLWLTLLCVKTRKLAVYASLAAKIRAKERVKAEAPETQNIP